MNNLKTAAQVLLDSYDAGHLLLELGAEVKALRAALAEPEPAPEPVAWIHGDEYADACHWVGGRMPVRGTKLYTADQLAAAVLRERERCAEYVGRNLMTAGEYAEAIRKGEPT